MVVRYKETVCDARAWIAGPEVGLLNLHFFNICRHHPTLKFKPHATDDERYVWGIDGVQVFKFKSPVQCSGYVMLSWPCMSAMMDIGLAYSFI